MSPEIKDIIFLDIETVSLARDYSTLDERLKTLWARKANYLRRDGVETDEELFNTRAGIYAEFGKVVCIVVGKFVENESGELTLRTKAYSGHNEFELLTEFKTMADRLDPLSAKFCAHNGKEFDYPYLCRRMLINGVQLPAILNISGRKSWEIQHLDTLEMWKFGDYKHYTSLELLATIFNIPSSKNNIDGSMVNSVYYQENDLERITTYCIGDVVVLSQLFLRLKGLPLVDQKNIIPA
jgi:DNA polymerase elongation subunit (family B)